MNKEEFLRELDSKLQTGEILPSELLLRAMPTPRAQESQSRFSITKILYVLGAAIVTIGVVFFVAQIWNDLGSLGRIAITLGFGLAMALGGSILTKERPDENIGSVFHAIGGVLIPGGTCVLLSELGLDNTWSIAAAFSLIALLYTLLSATQKRAVITLFAIANGTAAAYLWLNELVGGPIEGFLAGIKNIYEYMTLAIGASYLLLAHSFRDGWNKGLVGALCFFGSAGFLGAAFSLIFDSLFWEIGYIFILSAGLLLSVYMRSRAILTTSTIGVIAYVSYITGEYFADSLGWPLSLILLGFAFIGLGYASIAINKKYIRAAN